MDIKFRLKDFREENKIYQSDIAELWGVDQSTISRKERLQLAISGYQYDLLAQKYGEEKVSMYIEKATVQNAMQTRPTRPMPSFVANDDALAIIREQQQEIARLNKRIAELTDIIINK